MAEAPATTAPAEATSTDSSITTETTTETLGDGGQKALAEERRLRKEAEKRAKTQETELQKLRDANLNEVDKAIIAAKEEGKSEALREAGLGRVEDAVRAAAGGRQVDVDALLDGLDRTKFLEDDGGPDREAITAWVEKLAPQQEETQPGFPSLEQGTRSASGPNLGSNELVKALETQLGIR